MREAKDFVAADLIREQLRAGGWGVVDGLEGSRLTEIPPVPPPRAVTMLTLVHGWPDDVDRWLDAVVAHTSIHDYEAVLVDNSGRPKSGTA